MDLAAAERQLAADPDATRALIAQAMDHSKEGLEELRAPSLGFASPILLERGLVAALDSLAVRSPVSVALTNAPPTSVVQPQEVERNAYSVAREHLTNVTKHGSATSIRLRVGLIAAGAELELSVTDDGVGGAAVVAAHGLAGLEERLRGLRGRLVVNSPIGWPMVITAVVPLSRFKRTWRCFAFSGGGVTESALRATTSLRVLVADDSVLLREGLVRVLIEAGLEVAESYPDADSLLSELESKCPDLILHDVRMPPTFRDEGVRAAIRAREVMPRPGILLLSQYWKLPTLRNFYRPGGQIGQLLKERVASLNEFEEAIERAASGGTVLDPEVVAQLLRRRHDPLGSLTPREREVVTHVPEDRTNAAIAAAMVVGKGAVVDVTSIFQKLGLDDCGNDHRRVRAVLAWLQR